MKKIFFLFLTFAFILSSQLVNAQGCEDPAEGSDDGEKTIKVFGFFQPQLRKGHIPGAINFEFKKVLDAQGKLKSKADLTSMFTKAGMTKSKPIILYCETSVRAGILFLALKHAGYTKVKVYDGAFNQWIATASNKVAK